MRLVTCVNKNATKCSLSADKSLRIALKAPQIIALERPCLKQASTVEHCDHSDYFINELSHLTVLRRVTRGNDSTTLPVYAQLSSSVQHCRHRTRSRQSMQCNRFWANESLEFLILKNHAVVIENACLHAIAQSYSRIILREKKKHIRIIPDQLLYCDKEEFS